MASKEDVSPNDSQTVQVTVVIFYNGTNPPDQRTEPAVEIILLVLLLLVSFGSNIFLLATIVSSYTLRRIPFNLLFFNLCVVFLLETLWNMTVALLYVSAASWTLGPTGCAVSSFVIQLVTIEVTFSICLMCAEGMMSVWKPFLFQSFLTLKKQTVVIVTLWTAAILLCVPLLLQSIPSRLFPSRYGCAAAGPDGFAHALFLTLWCYCLMIVIGFGCLLNLGFRQYKEYRTQKKKNVVNFSNVFMQGDLWTEWINFKLVAWLALFYVLLELPYIFVHQASALKMYRDAQNSTSSSLIEYRPKYETVFTWFRYIYSCFFALLVFRMRKDIRQKFKALFNCCNSNIARENSAVPVVRHESKKMSKKDSVLPLSPNTPVLYISPDGLCLRQLDPSSQLSNSFHPKFVSYFCDVDSSMTTEELMNNSQSSFHSEGFSKESEVTLSDKGSSNLSEVQQRDIEALQREPPPNIKSAPMKKVRFADTLTIYHNLTPTPEWVVSTKKTANVRKRPSRIPTKIRRTDSIVPWKVELNSTYRVNHPMAEAKGFKKVVKDSKINGTQKARNKYQSKINTKIKMKGKNNRLSSQQLWKINK
ncbi:g_PROTEIN_RECEP_F1_2 domain-containing protein [Nephila pilipes]|uniref:G_PROTEIN_RECEP_F1_2 domain-containing protein n=1 Tax=Nephila pilipes TaxID=299642 RepID=A0A8X6NUK2_NEPPI|nr:g_PROTEIN_RECEP_F1_2 domain-containing protein [Nephila pilipes]